jgi:hypothetical protein
MLFLGKPSTMATSVHSIWPLRQAVDCVIFKTKDDILLMSRGLYPTFYMLARQNEKVHSFYFNNLSAW